MSPFQDVVQLEALLQQDGVRTLLLSQFSADRTDQQQLVDYHATVDMIAYAPSRLSNELKLATPKWLSTAYFPEVSKQALKAIKDQQDNEDNHSMYLLCGLLLSKFCRLGHTTVVLHIMFPYMLNLDAAVKLLLAHMDDVALERLVELLLSQLVLNFRESPASTKQCLHILRFYLDDVVAQRAGIRRLFTHKFLFEKVHSGAFAELVLRYIQHLNERDDGLLASTAVSICEVWSDQGFLLNASSRQSIYLWHILATLLHLLSTDDVHSWKLLQPLLAGVQLRLEKPDADSKRHAMAMAERVSTVLTPNEPLKFEELEDGSLGGIGDNEETVNGPAFDATYFEPPQHVDILDVDPDDPIENFTGLQIDISTMESESAIENELTLAEDQEGEADSDDEDEFGEYDLKDDESDLMAARPPRFLRDCMDGLRDKENVERQAVALKYASTLIRQDLPDLSILCVECARLLVHLEDTGSNEEFGTQKIQALQAIAVMRPMQVGPALCIEFYSNNTSLRNRYEVLEALAKAATELSSPPDSAVETPQKEAIVVVASPNRPWTEVIAERLEAKTRRWGSAVPRKSVQPVSFVNRFAPVASWWFFPFIKSIDDSSLSWKLFTHEPNLLGQLIMTLAVFIECAGPTCSFLGSMIQMLVQLISALRGHKEAFVRRALLSALSRVPLLLSATAIYESIPDLDDILTWLQRSRLEDPDNDCRKLAAGCLALFRETLSADSSKVVSL